MEGRRVNCDLPAFEEEIWDYEKNTWDCEIWSSLMTKSAIKHTESEKRTVDD